MLLHFVPAGGLIHIAEFTATICIAYLGLDALGERDVAVLQVASHIELVNEDLLNRLQPVKNGSLQVSFDCDELYMLAHVTRHFLPEAEKARKKKVVKWARRHCPLLWYFLDRRDLIVVPLICISSLIAFFGLSLLELVEIKIPEEIAIIAHLVFVICCLWIFYSVYASFQISKLPVVVDRTRENLNHRLKQIASESVERSIREVEKSTGESVKRRPRRPKTNI